jgi:MFS family permease
VILLVASISTACSFVMGWLIGFSIILIAAVGMIYAFSAIGDSPILSAGLTENVALPYLGAAFAVRSFLGFGAGAVSPLVFGSVLDWTNPAYSEAGIYATWGWSYSVLGLGGLGVVLSVCMHYRERSRR